MYLPLALFSRWRYQIRKLTHSLTHIAIVIGSALPVSASGPWTVSLFSSDPKSVLSAASQRAASNTVSAIVLSHEATFHFLVNGQLQRSQQIVYLIANEAGVKQVSKVA